MKKDYFKNPAYTSLFTALFIVCSWTVLPFPIPFTLQIFALFCGLEILGEKHVLTGIICWILMGSAGLPVFASFKGGIGVLFDATGGFIWGFIPAVICFTAFFKITKSRLISSVTAMLMFYICGCIWYTRLYFGGTANGFASAFTVCVLPFIIPDAIKIILGFYVGKRIKKLIKK